MPFRLCLFLLVAMLLLVGCGPEKGASDVDLAAETVRIAQAYQQSGDLASARAELERLEVANPTQFLIFLAEERASDEPGTPETNALVHFALALGVQSGQLMSYAMAHGLLANTEPPTPAAVALPAVQSVAPVVSSGQAQPAAPAAAPTSAPADVPPADAPATDVSTKTVPVAVVVDANGQAGGAAPAEQAPAAEALPTATPEPPTPTPVTKPQVQASNGLNVRSGPGTAYPIVGALASGQQAEIIAKNPEGDWWQVAMPGGGVGWVYGQLVVTTGDVASIAVASDIPPVPPSPTPAPVAAAPEQPAETPAETPAEQPSEAPQEEAPPPAEPPSGNDFYAVERRLWTVEETGGSVDAGGSVRCGEKRELIVIVLDANGNRLNGVAVQAIYGAQEIYVTGAQGKGDGQAEFVLGAGQGVKIIRDVDGREVTSDVIDGMTTHSPKISHEDLIAARYCTDEASCNKFNSSAGCWGHHSWTVTFKRRY